MILSRMTSLFLTGSLLTGFHGLLCANADPSGILTLTVIEEQIPENRGCSATDLSITLAPGMNPDRERVAGYQRRLGSNLVAEATVGITILGPQYDIGIAEGRIGVAWLITSSGRTPREATPRSD
ncbi:hypothetical protein EB061_02435 [bacterium]|nr:hypothetical protein [bacterium]